MYSVKQHINILTAALVAYGVEHIVVCPGSRNSPLVHNFNEHPEIQCHPVTDERSAGFVALGIRLATNQPVAVCVTSGSALLNLLPAVAEATYQHQGIIVISADRPAEWINQFDGQTLPQPHALGDFVKCCVNISEWPNNSATQDESPEDSHRWACGRMIAEALLRNQQDDHPSVHINVSINEPLFDFAETQLPCVQPIQYYRMEGKSCQIAIPERFDKILSRSSKVLLVCGQLNRDLRHEDALQKICQFLPVICEPLSWTATAIDSLLTSISDSESLLPDTVIYLGRTLVSKKLKQFLRRSNVQVWAVSVDGEIHDVFQHQVGLIHANPTDFLVALQSYCATNKSVRAQTSFLRSWNEALSITQTIQSQTITEYSQAAAVQTFERMLPKDPIVHFANSSVIRLACIYARHFVWCNRGLNGIEGSLSTAVGHSLVVSENVYCVIGDLSFFYDSNALWNQHLRGNLRILLLNNHSGGIFNQLPGLEQSPALPSYIAAQHQTNAEYLCQAYQIEYHQVRAMDELPDAMHHLLHAQSQRPIILEVFTDAHIDSQTYQMLLKDYDKLENH